MRVLLIIAAMCAATAGAWFSFNNRDLYIQAALYSEGFNISADAKIKVAEYYKQNAVLPHDNEQAGLPPAYTFFGTSVKRVSIVRDGVIQVAFNDDMDNSLMVFSPQINVQDGSVSWNCTSDSIPADVLEKLRPICVYQPGTAENRLMEAIADQDSEAITRLLAGSVDVEALINGNTPLMLAAKIGNVKNVELLLEAGAKPNHARINSERRTPLMVALSLDNAEVVSLLLSRGADVERKDYNGMTAFDYARQTDSRNNNQRYELMLAASNNPLFQGRSDNKNTLSPQEKRKKLLSRFSEFEYAANTCHVKRLETLLIEAGDYQAGEMVEGRALTTHTDRPECRERLARFVKTKPSWQQALEATLHANIDECKATATRDLLQENPSVDVLAENDQGVSLLHRSVISGCTDVLRVYLRDRDLTDQLDADLIVTSIKEVPQSSILKTVSLLVEAGADIQGSSKDGFTPLTAAIAFEQPVVAKLLVDAGAPTNSRTESGAYPVIEATKKGYDHLVSHLLVNGADVNVRDRLGRTALHAAVAKGRQRTVNALLGAGANTRIKDANGMDAVVIAESKRFKSIHSMLLDF